MNRTLSEGRFVLNGRPFLIVGAEIHNSGSSTPTAIRRSLESVATIGANTVLAPIAWESIEPREGEFDFALVDALVEIAQRLSLKLIPLWFGTWKNGMSTYAPEWVKLDTDRFPLIRTATGAIPAVSPFSTEARDADARAFAKVMRRLREIDRHDTVLMMQVENEVGVLGDSRDRNELAAAQWDEPVPATVVNAVRAMERGRLHRALGSTT
ncbi:MAG TPA: beta-galactosidase, partial [Pseudolysinimonas sp.]|nr:beta-galactosidase [Pseudolysinimonas sp.]